LKGVIETRVAPRLLGFVFVIAIGSLPVPSMAISTTLDVKTPQPTKTADFMLGSTSSSLSVRWERSTFPLS
jgi:hypothetical protein